MIAVTVDTAGTVQACAHAVTERGVAVSSRAAA